MLTPVYKVLLVEDVPMIARLTAQMLKKAPDQKYTSAHAATLAAALELLRKEDFDLVLLDLNLPDSADLATVSRVIETTPDVPIVVLTASDSEATGLRAVQLGAQDFLVKGEFNHLALDRSIVYAVERHRLQRTIRQLAIVDELTGLYNRRGFNALHGDVFQRAARSDQRGYLVFFDLDRFKQINDELGHARGDEALQEFAATLRGVFRKDALLVRLGGDEFVAMGVEHQPGQVEESLHHLEVVLGARHVSGAAEFRLESSAGVAWFGRENLPGLEALTAAADAALYRHKEERRRRRADQTVQEASA